VTEPSLVLSAEPSFSDLALAELRRVSAYAKVVGQPAPGVSLIAGVPFQSVAAAWARQPPIFARHICPVEWSLAVSGAPEDIDLLVTSLVPELTSRLSPEQSFSVQTRIFGRLSYTAFLVNKALSTGIAEAVPIAVDVRAPEQIVSLMVTPARAYAGVSRAADNLSAWAGGMHRFAREPEQISRAEFKLLEALSTFRLDLPAGGRALDLGAAPGGWTRVLRQRGQFVTSVDPAELHAALLRDTGVRHVRQAAEAYLRSAPEPFDLIVNDMRLDVRDSARVMLACAPFLRKKGFALMTFKLPLQKRAAAVAQASSALSHGYAILGARQLFHNRSEITVYLEPKA
jgi:23S rRNA (cytidine2498-2'-O)-methyltransferase